jgi:5-methylcytosine-specific restriction protein A
MQRNHTAAYRRLVGMVRHEEPLCRHCLSVGKVRATVEVDHIVPLARGGGDARANLQGLCFDCHSRKTANEAAINALA